MDPVTAIFIFIITVGLGEEIKENQSVIDSQQVEIAELNNDFLRLAGAHAAANANHKHVNREQQAQIDNLEDRVEYLNDKVNILHP